MAVKSSGFAQDVFEQKLFCKPTLHALNKLPW